MIKKDYNVLLEKAKQKYDEVSLHNNMCGTICDGDTILKDIMDEADFEVSGIFEDIYNLFKKTTDPESMAQLFFEFTDIDFEDYLQRCINESRFEQATDKKSSSEASTGNDITEG